MTISVLDSTGQTAQVASATELLAALGAIATAATAPASQPVTASSLPLPFGAATDAKLEAVRALLAATIAVSVASLPLPAGAATDVKLEALRALLAGTITVSAASLPLPTGAATATAQAATTAAVAATASADDIYAITPSDSTNLATVPKALYVTNSGTLSVQGSSGATVSLGTVAAGQVIPLRVRRVLAAGTTATVVGLA